MNQDKLSFPQLFKGIALFTPGGDLVYCIDPDKQTRWHLQLCAVLQEILGLAEPPHFLVPCYTATIDRWLDPRTQQIQISAEANPLVLKHQALLNAVFSTPNLVWQAAPQEGLCDSLVLATYRQQFLPLWQDHDLVMRFEGERQFLTKNSVPQQAIAAPDSAPNSSKSASKPVPEALAWFPTSPPQPPQGYVLRLFVSGHSAATEQILKNLHQLFETALQQPYTLKVVDVYKNPEQAEADHVAATPTLVKVYPPPVRRLVGDLDDARKILQILASQEAGESRLE